MHDTTAAVADTDVATPQWPAQDYISGILILIDYIHVYVFSYVYVHVFSYSEQISSTQIINPHDLI